MASGWLEMKELHLAILETGSVTKGEGRKGVCLFPCSSFSSDICGKQLTQSLLKALRKADLCDLQ